MYEATLPVACMNNACLGTGRVTLPLWFGTQHWKMISVLCVKAWEWSLLERHVCMNRDY